MTRRSLLAFLGLAAVARAGPPARSLEVSKSLNSEIDSFRTVGQLVPGDTFVDRERTYVVLGDGFEHLRDVEWVAAADLRLGRLERFQTACEVRWTGKAEGVRDWDAERGR